MNQTYLFFFILFSLLACNSKEDKAPAVKSFRPGIGVDFPAPVEEPLSGTDDPLVPFAWHLENTGQSSFSTGLGVAGKDFGITKVHAMGIRGSGIRIAVSDSGTDIDHPDLKTNSLSGEHRSYSGSPSTWHGSNPLPEDGQGHGTAVTGLIAAEGWNGIGSRGVSPHAQYAAFYFLGTYRDTSTSYEARILDQLTGDFDIFNYSYGYPGCSFFPTSESIVSAYQRGVTRLRGGLGAIYVKAAGNEYKGLNSDCRWGDSSTYWGNTNTGEDQNHPYLIMTAALNARGEISSYSSPGSGLWISSAGGEFGYNSPAMITTDIQGCHKGISVSDSGVSSFNRGAHELNLNCSYTNAMNGTSSAAPTLAGVIALMLEANPKLSWRDVKHILATTALPVNYSINALSHPGGANLSGHIYDYNYVQNAAGFKFSNTYGFGSVDALKAVEAALNYDFPLGTYTETISNGVWNHQSGNIHVPIPDASSAGASHSLNVSSNIKIESVQVRVTIEHPFISDVGVELTSPSGTTSKLLLINSNIKDRGLYDYVLLSNAFYQESSQGSWRIKVIDARSGNTGKLTRWAAKINGARL